MVTQGAYIETLVVAPFTSRPRNATGMIVAKVIYHSPKSSFSGYIYLQESQFFWWWYDPVRHESVLLDSWLGFVPQADNKQFYQEFDSPLKEQ